MITKIYKHDTMAVVKITNWRSSEVLKQLNQDSVVSGDHFIREVRFGSKLMQQLENMESQGNLALETVTTYCSPSERLKQLAENTCEDSENFKLTKVQLISLAKQSYLEGGYDKDHDIFQWCNQGSSERAEELLEDFLQEIENDANP